MKQIQDQSALITITRSDISSGYQVAQTAHAVSQFAHKFPKEFTDWITGYNCIISLSVNCEQDLENIYESLRKEIAIIKFEEPDIDNEVTAICFWANSELRKRFSNLPLALKTK